VLYEQCCQLARKECCEGLARYPDAYDTGTRGTYCGSADTTRASSVAVRALTWADDVVEALVEESLGPEDGDGQRAAARPPGP